MTPFSSCAPVPGMIAPGRREDAGHAGAGIGRAADDLHLRSVTGIDHADAQAIGVGMLLGGDDPNDTERRVLLRRIVHGLDLEADHGQPVDDAIERRRGIEMLLEPGEGELHDDSPPASVGRSSGRKP